MADKNEQAKFEYSDANGFHAVYIRTNTEASVIDENPLGLEAAYDPLRIDHTPANIKDNANCLGGSNDVDFIDLSTDDDDDYKQNRQLDGINPAARAMQNTTTTTSVIGVVKSDSPVVGNLNNGHHGVAVRFNQADCTSRIREQKQTVCYDCKLVFATPHLFQNHVILIHANKLPYQCSFCKLTFSLKTDLNAHMREHFKQKPFWCNVCGAKYSRKWALTNHMKVHSVGQPLFGCFYCPSKFIWKTSLTRHMKTHAIEFPHDCPECRLKFKFKTDLEAHIKKHTGENPFPCIFCPLKFSTAHALTVHMKMHTDAYPEAITAVLHDFNAMIR